MQNKTIIGNWKMNKHSLLEVEAFCSDFLDSACVGFALSVPYIYLSYVKQKIKESGKPVKVFAQNVHFEKEGAYTGEISPVMLKNIGVDGAIIAHSERRKLFYETNETASKKSYALLKEGLSPVYCIGETLQERETGLTKQVIEKQVIEGLNLHDKECLSLLVDQHDKLLIAYEPVWAIGTGKSAELSDINIVHQIIKDTLSHFAPVLENTSILYGGSVTSKNSASLLSSPLVNGLLVGKSSLDPAEFLKLMS